jgi:hypothetical protein
LLAVETESMALLRGLTDSQLTAALVQIKTLGTCEAESSNVGLEPLADLAL